MTDQLLMVEHLQVALRRVRIAMAHMDRLTPGPREGRDVLTNDRAELARIEGSLGEIISRWEVDR